MAADEKTDVAGDSVDEAIGRPGPWGEGRYQEAGKSVDQSVVRKPGEGPADTTSSTVTRRDYESLEKPERKPASSAAQ